jgi:hypothetical protein
MAMRLADGWTAGGTIGSWPLPGEPAFAKSRAYELLFRDLRRYVQEEVPGRSFLIAGHRGAGKTTTVIRAVQRLRSELLRLSADPDNAAFGRRGRLQRPLLVKLVGQSLIAPPPRPAENEKRCRAAAENGGHAGTNADGGNNAGDATNARANAGAVEKSADQVENALVHITIALYRALAGEIAQAFAIHAGASRGRDRRDLMELGAQLALELDGTPEPALLRRYWDKLGRLGGGVLWPPRTDQTFRRRSIADQGLREIVAVTAAAQAFQVCSGQVTDLTTSKDMATNDQALESQVDVKDLVSRLGAVGAGTLAGSVVGASGGALPGVGTGILVWVLSGVALTWTTTRSRKKSRTLDYTFLKDRTIQTLDRDLPLVIERIREAGLAPVFVIDELDKLPKPGKTIALIINRIKHLVSDYGFFCFLTDRGYFDEIEQKVAKQAYPTEHTYFSQRVLVINRPQDLFGYLVGFLDPKNEATGAEAFPNDVFALSVIFRSKLNFSDVARETARLTGEKEELICSEEDLRRPGEFRLAATIQLAINQVLLDENVADRFESDSVFAQLAIDALYYIPRCWELNIDAGVDIRQATIKEDLIGRMRSRTPDESGAQSAVESPGKKAATAGNGHANQVDDAGAASDEPTIPKADLRQLVGLVSRMAEYLRDFRKLTAAIAEREGDSPRLAPIVVVEKDRLLRPETPRSRVRFRFTLDELANPVDQADAAAQSPAEEGPDEKSVLEDERALIEAIAKLLETAELSIDQLVANRILPTSLTDGLLRTTFDDLNIALRDLDLPPRARKQKQARENGHNGWLAFSRALDNYGERLAQALGLIGQVRKEAHLEEAPVVVLSRIARYFSAGAAPAPIGGDWKPALAEKMGGQTGSVVRFTRRYAAYVKKEIIAPPVRDEAIKQRWDVWRDHLVGYLCRRQPGAIAVDYLDVLLAARGEAPGRLFRANVEEMDLIDWSAAALAPLSAENVGAVPPFWLTIAALTALKFSRPALVKIWEEAKSNPDFRLKPEDQPAFEQLIEATGPRPVGLLHVYPDDMPVRRPAEIPESRPLLSLGYSLLEKHMSGLNWLADRNVIDGGIDEVGGSGGRPPLQGTLARFVWVTVTQESRGKVAAASEDLAHDIRSSETLIEAFGRRQRGPESA